MVGPFYTYWSNYCTLRSYVWKEEHDTREALDRRVRRLMEQENKKKRDKAKKERNEEVRVSHRVNFLMDSSIFFSLYLGIGCLCEKT